ncbi:hypothetical protein B0H13DRAFT_2372472 [Mycena leptocephala]|nr:hypothetical protein B0H13DRAFT_2372472 [Mycena leptocephala]
MPHQGPPCTPPTFNHGDSLGDHDANSECYYWSVVIGRVPGIYLDFDEANAQVYKAHNQKMKRFHTHSEAVAFWDEWCLRLHEDHSAPRYKVKGLKGEFATYDEALAAAASKYIFPA